MTETPNTVHGRLLEAVHLSGYTFDRACAELEYLLDEDRWKAVGQGYTDINAFLGTIDFSGFRIAVDQRKKLARRLQGIEASQRATARLVGVDHETVRTDLGRNGEKSPRPADKRPNAQQLRAPDTVNGEKSPTAWFQAADADPASDAKRITKQAARVVEREQIREAAPEPALPTGRYRLLLADPPWRYEHVETESRAIENQYPTMSLDDICALPIPAADDAVLFLWATSPKLIEAARVIEAWQFTYRTGAVWDKLLIGMGYYFRQQHEHLLVATRGHIAVPDPSTRPASVMRERRGTHSEKPAIAYTYIEGMYPDLTDRIELFARTPRDGWARWGNQV